MGEGLVGVLVTVEGMSATEASGLGTAAARTCAASPPWSHEWYPDTPTRPSPGSLQPEA